MNIGIFCDSRGASLGPELHQYHDTTQVYVYKRSGATLNSIIPMIREFHKRVHYDAIYVMVGNNDLTVLDKDNYTISLVEENPYDVCDIFTNKLTFFKLEVSQFMHDHPVVMLPLTPVEMSMYNESYHRDPKQWILNMAIDLINVELVYQNTWNRLSTPLIHEVIHKAQGHGAYRYYFNRLKDGLHPTLTTTRKWACKFRHAMTLNGHI